MGRRQGWLIYAENPVVPREGGSRRGGSVSPPTPQADLGRMAGRLSTVPR